MSKTPTNQTTAGLSRRARSKRRFVLSKAAWTGEWWLPGWEPVCAAMAREGLMVGSGKWFSLTDKGRIAKAGDLKDAA